MSTDEGALVHKKRRIIYERVRISPGITFRELRDLLDVPHGTLEYHLHFLVRSELISKRTSGGRRCYFPCDQRMLSIGMHGTRKSIVEQRIVSGIGENPGITHRDLATITKTNKVLLSYYLKRMIGRGIVERRKLGREAHYFKVDVQELRKRMIKALIDDLIDGVIGEEEFREVRLEIDKRLTD